MFGGIHIVTSTNRNRLLMGYELVQNFDSQWDLYGILKQTGC